jgi:small subunit ribosomal protein S19
MARSIWKGPYVDPSVLRKVFKPNKSLKVYSRRSVIMPEFVGKELEVHNGHKFISISITEHMVGHKFGEFASTRKQVKHKVKKGKK